LLMWLVVLAAAGYRLLRQARDAERFWVPGVAAALAAGAVHNLFDSLLFVPAIAMLTWTLIGIATAPATTTSEALVEPAARARKRSRESSRSLPGPAWALWVGGVLLALVGIQVAGMLQLKEGLDGLGPMTAREKLPTLRIAQLLLPWDIQVARAASRAQASLGLDNLDEAVRQAHRLLRIAPYRMPTYKWIGTLYKAQGRPDLALATYEQGLRHVPNEATLLYALAEAQQELGLRRETMETYRRLVEVEASPVGQVRALSEHIEWRFAKAHLALSSLSAPRDNPDAPFQHRRAAACLLAQRRLLFHGNPAAYLAVEELDADLERSLRADEEKLWQRLAVDFEERGDTRAAELAREQSGKVDETREQLEQIIKEVHENR
ncbi:MAG: tetratricopeptide repeat protein, partial [Actinomycetota bacterium]